MSFRIDATFEDTRIVAVGDDPNSMTVTLSDLFDGTSAERFMTLEEVGKLVGYCASGLDGNDLLISYDECAAIQADHKFPDGISLIP